MKKIINKISVFFIVLFKGVEGIFEKENAVNLFKEYYRKHNLFVSEDVEVIMVKHNDAAKLLNIYMNYSWLREKALVELFKREDVLDILNHLDGDRVFNLGRVCTTKICNIILTHKDALKICEFCFANHVCIWLSCEEVYSHPNAEQIINLFVKAGERIRFAEHVADFPNGREIIAKYIENHALYEAGEEMLFEKYPEMVEGYISRRKLSCDIRLLQHPEAHRLVSKYAEKYELSEEFQETLLNEDWGVEIILSYAEKHQLCLTAQQKMISILKEAK